MHKAFRSPQRIVPAGAYVVSKANKQVLTAHLGRCVWLSLCGKSKAPRHGGRGGPFGSISVSLEP
jgi:hypothetical protein